MLCPSTSCGCTLSRDAISIHRYLLSVIVNIGRMREMCACCVLVLAVVEACLEDIEIL